MDEAEKIDLQALKLKLEPILRGYPITAAYAFGSLVSGATHVGSDIDVAILPSGQNFSDSDRASLTADIASAVGRPEHDIDVSLLPELPLPLRFRIAQAGFPLSLPDERRAREYMLKDVALYHDQYPFIQAANQRFVQGTELTL